MNWYVKLFAPALVAVAITGLLLMLIWLDLYSLIIPRPDEKLLGPLAVIVIGWGAIQSLYFPKRPHKSRIRFFLMAAIGIYLTFFLYAFATNNPGQEWLFALFGGALMASIAYGLRYRSSPYTLAPGWSQIKFLGTLFSFIGLTIILLYGLDQVFFKLFRPSRLERNIAPYFLIACAISGIGGIISYYVEAILHYRRNNIENWQKSINKMGDS